MGHNLRGELSSLLNARFILGSYYELRPPKSVARERYASVLQYKHTGCGGRGDLKTGQHARQAARRASHDTQERRLSFRYTRESVKVLCCVTTPAPYAVGRSMCMHLSKHLSPSPFRPHIALAWKTTNLPLCGRNHRLGLALGCTCCVRVLVRFGANVVCPCSTMPSADVGG